MQYDNWELKNNIQKQINQLFKKQNMKRKNLIAKRKVNKKNLSIKNPKIKKIYNKFKKIILKNINKKVLQ